MDNCFMTLLSAFKEANWHMRYGVVFIIACKIIALWHCVGFPLYR